MKEFQNEKSFQEIVSLLENLPIRASQTGDAVLNITLNDLPSGQPSRELFFSFSLSSQEAISSPGSRNFQAVGIAVGVIVGFLLLLFCILSAIFLVRKKRSQKQDSEKEPKKPKQDSQKEPKKPKQKEKKKEKSKDKTQDEIDLELNNVLAVDDVEIKEELGGGNFGQVYRGVWQGNTEVACKLLKDSTHMKEFAQEVQMLEKVRL